MLALTLAVILCPPEATARLEAALRAGDDVDAHHLAQALDALCPGDPAAAHWRLLDAVALTRLEETPRARALLQAGLRGPDAALQARAAALLAWSLWRTGDGDAFHAALARVPEPARLRLEALAAAGEDEFGSAAARLDPTLRARAVELERRASARERRPWLAGTLSAIVPGLGQAYAGSWQGAAVAFVLNGVLIGATVELARKELYFAAGATGLAASIFYVGNIANAADLARRRNEIASEGARDALERALVPEVEGP
jgi:hypothetical protein